MKGRRCEVVDRDRLEAFLRGEGLSDRPDLYGSSIHSWRCEYPDRYGACTCFADFLDGLVAVVEGRALPEPPVVWTGATTEAVAASWCHAMKHDHPGPCEESRAAVVGMLAEVDTPNHEGLDKV